MPSGDWRRRLRDRLTEVSRRVGRRRYRRFHHSARVSPVAPEIDALETRIVLAAEVSLFGNGISIADSDISPSATDHTDFGTIVQGTSLARVFTVRNDGDETLTLQNLSVPEGFAVTNTLVASLAPGASDTFALQLLTSTAGTKSGTVRFVTNDSDESQFDFSIKGVVLAPEISVYADDATSAPILDGDTTPSTGEGTDFGIYYPGLREFKSITIGNTGTSVLTLGTPTAPPGFYIIFFPTSVAPGAYANFLVGFDTNNAVGTWSGDIFFATNELDESVFNFRVTGSMELMPGPEVTVTGSGYEIVNGDSTSSSYDNTDFGIWKVGTSRTGFFSVYNSGDTTLSLGPLSVPEGYIVDNNLVSSLAPGASDLIVLRLDTTTPGTKSGVVSFTTSDPNESLTSFSITGLVEAGTGPEVLVRGFDNTVVLDGQTVVQAAAGAEFGTVTQSHDTVTRTFTAMNVGSSPLSLSNLSVTPGFTITDGLVSTLGTAQSDTFTVQLDTTVVGDRTGEIWFSTNDSDENFFSFLIHANVTANPFPEVTVTGNGVSILDDSGVVSGGDNDFGTLRQGEPTISKTFVVRNDGFAALTLSNLVVPAGFTITEGLVSTLAPNASDSFTLRLDTTVSGNKSGTVSFTTNDVGENPFNFAIGGQILPPPAPRATVFGNSRVINDGDSSPVSHDGTDFTSVLPGANVTRSFTVRNDGDVTMTLSDLEVPAGFTITDNLESSLPPGASDSFTVRLDTSTVGTKSGEIRFTTNDPERNPFNFAVSGVVTLTPTPEIQVRGDLNFIDDGQTTFPSNGSVSFDLSTQGGIGSSITYTVTNAGSVPLTLGAVVVPTGFLVTEGLASTLGPNASDTFTVTLDTTIPGFHVGNVSFATNDPDENPFIFAIRGTVLQTGGADVQVLGNDVQIADGDAAPSAVDFTDFGSVTQGGTPLRRTFLIRNAGDSVLNLSNLTVPAGFRIVDQVFGVLHPGFQDEITVELDSAVAGTWSGEIRFTTTDPDESLFNFAITGTVLPPPAPEVTVLGNSVINIVDDDTTPSAAEWTDFGTVVPGTFVTKAYRVQNTGTATLTLGTVTVPEGFIVNSLAGSLEPGAFDTFSVWLDTTTVGVKSGQISFTTNDSDENPFNFSVTGAVVLAPGPEITLVGGSLLNISDGDTTPAEIDFTDFGNVVLGTAFGRTFNVFNSGDQTLTLGPLTVPTGFIIVNDLVSSLAPGESDEFALTIDSTTLGTKSGQVSFVSNDPNENPFNFALRGTVVLAPGPEVTVRGNNRTINDGSTLAFVENSTSWGNVTEGDPPISHTFSVLNSGDAPLNLSGLVVSTGFTIIENLATTLPSGATDTFTVQLDTTTVGTKTGQISFITNDPNENPFNFTVRGVVDRRPVPEVVVVTTSSQVIFDGDSTPESGDLTNFGSIVQGTTGISRTWVVRNTGDGVLNLSGLVVPTGFNITEGLVASLGSFEEDSFTVQVDSSTVGVKSGEISFANNDSDENPYNFAIIAAVIEPPLPEVTVLGDAVSIADGDGNPSATDLTAFGIVTEGQATVSRTFTVRNDGYLTLNLSALEVPVGFTITEGLSPSLGAGATDTFTVRLDTSVVGAKTGEIRFATNDSDESTFNFTISGTVLPAPAPEVTVFGNWFPIGDGDSTPVPNDGTDFGTVVLGETAVRTFVVRNDGTAPLSVSALRLPNGFSIVDDLAANLAPGQLTYFTVQIDTSTVGSKYGEVSFTTNDGDESPFNFSITGTVTPPAIITASFQDGINGYTGTTDARIRGDSPTNNGGTVTSLQAHGNPDKASLIRWDLGSIPTNAVVQSASITLNVTNLSNGSYEIYGLLNPWIENQVTWNQASTGTNWSTAGVQGATDRSSTILGVITAPTTGLRTITLNSAGIVQLQSWINTPSTNNGIVIQDYAATDGLDFDSSETGIAANRPKLSITYTTSTPPAGPEVTVFANGFNILDGDTTPDASDFTDFGSVSQGGAPISRSFTVRNDGTAVLNLSGLVVPTGFTVTEGLSASLAAEAFDTFTVRLDTATVGTKSGQISFVTNDGDENPSNFEIRGTVQAAAAPEVAVLGNGVSIADGDATPAASDFTDFGSAPQGAATISRTFTVRNDGTAALNLSGLAVPTGFTITEGLSASLAAGASDSFTVRLDTTTAGAKSGQISFTTNDSDESPFNFSIIGSVTTGSSTTSASFQEGVGGYTGMIDSTIQASSPSSNKGTATTIDAHGNPDKGALLKWTLPASIPVGSVVQSASIILNITNTTTSVYELYEMLRNWTETGVTWNQFAAGSSWGAAGAQQVRVDRGSAVLGTLTSPGSGLVTINLNAAGIALVQKWIDNPSTNFGMIIQDYADTTNAGVGFDSSETGAAANRPKLTISYGSGSSLLAARLVAPTGAGSAVANTADAAELQRTSPEESMRSTPLTVVSANSGSLINQKSGKQQEFARAYRARLPRPRFDKLHDARAELVDDSLNREFRPARATTPQQSETTAAAAIDEFFRGLVSRDTAEM